ncbi:GntR family transcriptional regulator [Pseudochelatococcus sp. B33]
MRNGKSALYEELRHQILTLQRDPDEDLDEVKLSEQYGISRTPVRDVLRQLAVEGYVYIRENRGARVVPMNHATLRDFFSVAPIIYEAVGRLAIQNYKREHLEELQRRQNEFAAAVAARDPVGMVVANNHFHTIIGLMSNSTFLLPSYSKLLIDHERIGHTFFRPTNEEMENDLLRSCQQHESMIKALIDRDEGRMVQLTYEHWDLCRGNMESFIAPKELKSRALDTVFNGA